MNGSCLEPCRWMHPGRAAAAECVARQERYFEKKFYAQIELKMLKSSFNISLPPICTTATKFMDYVMSWCMSYRVL